MIHDVYDLPGVIVIDDFLPEFDRVREHAKLSHFYDWKAQDGAVYKRISLLHVPGMFDTLTEHLGDIRIAAMGYRLNYENEEPNQSIHADLGFATHVALVYLNEGDSGTAFWQHKETKAAEIWYGQQELFQQIKDDFESPEAWEQRLVVPTKKNRAVIYKANLFHSRFPFAAFGSTPDDGRLIALAFFTFTAEEEALEEVE
jgi:hypothetical protein